MVLLERPVGSSTRRAKDALCSNDITDDRKEGAAVFCLQLLTNIACTDVLAEKFLLNCLKGNIVTGWQYDNSIRDPRHFVSAQAPLVIIMMPCLLQ